MWRRQLRLMGIPSVSPLTWCWCWIEKSGAQNKNLKRQIRYICVFVPQVIFSACELGVFDLLLKSQEPLSAQHVARELETSEDGMERLLDALVGIEILEVENTKGTGEEEEEAGLQSALWLYTWADLFICDVRHWRQVMRSLSAWLCYKSLNVNKDSAGNGGKNTITWPRWRHKNACLRLETVKNIINDKEKH